MAYETTDQLIAEAADHWNKHHDTVFYNLIDIFNQYLGKIDDNGKKIEEDHLHIRGEYKNDLALLLWS